jgi:hypothetical protein
MPDIRLSTFAYRFWRWYIVWFVVAFLVVRRYEHLGVFDSVDLWSSFFAAGGIALPVAVICAAFGKAVWSNLVLPRR